MNFDDFKEDYADFVSDIFDADYQTYEERLTSWLGHLENFSISRDRIEHFASLMDYTFWYEAGKATVTDIGDGQLEWSADQHVRLGQEIWLFRHFSTNKGEFIKFSECFDFVNNFNSMLDRINRSLFKKCQRELLKDIERQVAATSEYEIKAMLFTDVVSSTTQAEEMGDDRWRELIADHNVFCRRKFERYRGKEIKQTGDGFLATFDSCGSAIVCAIAILEAVKSLGLHARAGVHVAEVKVSEGDIFQHDVNVASRIMNSAPEDKCFASAAVRNLLSRQDFIFESVGDKSMDGISQAMELFIVSYPSYHDEE